MLPEDVSAVVCTMNSIASIEACLQSLRAAGVGEVIVVDAASQDGTREIAVRIASRVLEDPGTGLGQARNLGIAATTGALVLNMGSDNVMSGSVLQGMIDALEVGGHAGVSAMTHVPGDDYLSRCLDTWRTTRFRAGAASVIGTPTLFRGDLLRGSPYDDTREHSDDAEICERWTREFGATFAIASVSVDEVGKTSWSELRLRCRNYGVSDYEVFVAGSRSGWGVGRQIKSLTHPVRVDLMTPLARAKGTRGLQALPFLAAITGMRYFFWAKKAARR